MVRARASAPATGLRRLVYRVSCGTLILGPSAAEVRHHDLVARVKTPIDGCRHSSSPVERAASERRRRAPSWPTRFAALPRRSRDRRRRQPRRGHARASRSAARTPRRSRRSSAIVSICAPTPDVRAYTSQAPTRLEVLAADDDPRITQALGEEDFRTVVDVLSASTT